MKAYLVIVTFLMVNLTNTFGSFKEEQKKYPRVRQAYNEKWPWLIDLLEQHNIDQAKINVYIRAFKAEQIIEVWAKNDSDSTFKLFVQYDICASSGTLGPKRQQGDLQVPEGFYVIDRFNPASNYHLSLGINYPNMADRILGVNGELGGDIFIHGNCVTIGCLPITDEKIKELYLICVEAKNNGQKNIPVTIYPCKLTDENYNQIKQNTDAKGTLQLWSALKDEYTYFERSNKISEYKVLKSGAYQLITK